LLLSEAVARVPDGQREAQRRALLERIAEGQYRIRYSNANELSTARGGHRDPHVQYNPPHDGKGLHADFFRLGSINWPFSMVTFGGLTVHQVEVFYPDPEPARAEGKAGRPSSADLVRVAAERVLSEGMVFKTLEAFAQEVQTSVTKDYPKAPGTELATIKNIVRPLHPKNRLIKSF
jgi:hypothetical protein